MGGIRHTAEATRKRNEELTQATRLAEEAVKQKNTFIQNVTHQIRTPLNIILGFSQILRDSVVRRSAEGRQGDDSLSNSEEVENIKSIVKHNAAHLNRMVLMLYDSSDTGLSKGLSDSHNRTMANCIEIARECLDCTQKHFPDLVINFVADVPDTLAMHTNHVYFMRSLRELLYNAAKYSDGKSITLRLSETPESVRFIVEDTGNGIPEEYRDTIYETFIKADELSEGLGLGLPLTKRHIDNLGGTLTLDTDYHKGCRFIIEMPKMSKVQ
jgi:signal transduction histidine kinase